MTGLDAKMLSLVHCAISCRSSTLQTVSVLLSHNTTGRPGRTPLDLCQLETRSRRLLWIHQEMQPPWTRTSLSPGHAERRSARLSTALHVYDCMAVPARRTVGRTRIFIHRRVEVNVLNCRCDTRSHYASELADWRAGDVGRVVPGACSRPGPALSCAAGNGGVRSSPTSGPSIVTRTSRPGGSSAATSARSTSPGRTGGCSATATAAPTSPGSVDGDRPAPDGPGNLVTRRSRPGRILGCPAATRNTPPHRRGQPAALAVPARPLPLLRATPPRR